MSREPKVYIALEDEAGQLIVDGPLKLLDRLVATLTGPSRRKVRSQSQPAPTPGPQQAAEPQEGRHV